MSNHSGILYIVSTPIGNLADISLRALDTLKSVNLIAAEDTRHSSKLLKEYQIQTPLTSLHEHNEHSISQYLINKLQAGENIALISDAGTPLISDPGYLLVKSARELGLTVSCIPGPSAVIAALSISGLPTHAFVFEGFLPAKQSARKSYLEKFICEPRTVVFYESSHRILACLDDMLEVFGAERRIAIVRELTKLYENVINSDLKQAIQRMTKDPNQQRGEFVIVLAGAKTLASDEQKLQEYLSVLIPEVSVKLASQLVAKLTGLSKNAVYRYALQFKDNQEQ